MYLNSQNNEIFESGPVDSRKSLHAGFTLLEVLISMAVLVMISFAIYQATTETFKLRETLAIEGNFFNGIRLSITIIQRDISLIFSPLALLPETQAKSIGNSGNQGNLGHPLNPDEQDRNSLYWSPAANTNGIRPSHFVGTEDKVSFVSLSHIRIYKDSPESEIAKISYELKKDEKNTDNPGTLVLVKTESPNAFASDDIKDTLSRSYELLHGISKLTYTYYQREGNTWKNLRSWDSDKEETKNIIPDIIEIKLEVKGPKNLNFEGKYKFRPEIPLNGLNHST